MITTPTRRELLPVGLHRPSCHCRCAPQGQRGLQILVSGREPCRILGSTYCSACASLQLGAISVCELLVTVALVCLHLGAWCAEAGGHVGLSSCDLPPAG
jgi:hypothetical protein